MMPQLPYTFSLHFQTGCTVKSQTTLLFEDNSLKTSCSSLLSSYFQKLLDTLFPQQSSKATGSPSSADAAPSRWTVLGSSLTTSRRLKTSPEIPHIYAFQRFSRTCHRMEAFPGFLPLAAFIPQRPRSHKPARAPPDPQQRGSQRGRTAVRKGGRTGEQPGDRGQRGETSSAG